MDGLTMNERVKRNNERKSKQSIYSFQGADPLVMRQNRIELSSRAKATQANFCDVPLSVSFRSASPILDLVNKTIPDLVGIDDFTTHEVARRGAGGFVELWPVVKGNDDFGVEDYKRKVQ